MVTHEILQDLSDLGMSRRHMAELFGCCRPTINGWLRINAVTTDGQGHRKRDEIHGVGGKQPAKLMPSAEALRCVSVWGLAGHAPTVFRSPNEVITNDNENEIFFRKASSWTA